jgi:Tol biopolymer transport system component
MQIADALDRAHRAGIVHRDLKPGNVMLTKAGAKLMDFGLARSSGPESLGGASGMTAAALSQSPTMSRPLTMEGTIVGTFQYMSPEQLEGNPADARSDLWALGCVLYEMATGRQAFAGKSQASLITAIMSTVPASIAELTPSAPPALDHLVRACLAKDPDDRIQTAHDVRLQLQWASEGAIGATSSASRALGGGTARRGLGAPIAWGVAALSTAIAAVALAMLLGRTPGAAPGRARLMIQPPQGASLSGAATTNAISPDGRTLAFIAADSTGTGRLWLRDLDALTGRALEGTDHADQPFWSPDSRWLAFFADGKLKKVAVAGGIPEVVCDAPDPRGGTWGKRGIIVFAPIAAGALFSVSSDGGEVTELVRPDPARKETALRFPNFLPDGRQFLFVSLPGRGGEFDVHLGQLGSAERREVMRAGAAPVFAEPGYLITVLGARLVAQPFDARDGKLSGKPITLGSAPLKIGHDGVRVVSASRTGSLAYWSGSLSNTQCQWLDREGRAQDMLPLASGRWEEIFISPDGRQAILSRRGSATEKDLWMIDIETRSASRFTFTSTAPHSAVWSSDSRRVVYSDFPHGPGDIFVKSTSGRESEPLLESDVIFKNPNSWSPDGKFIAFEQPDPETGWDVWALPIEGDRKPIPLIRTSANESGGWISPDGGWIVYSSDESGRPELYVESFPQPSARVPLTGSGTSGTSTAGPCWWSRDSREIMFLAGRSVRVAAIDAGATFHAGPARTLFELPAGWVAMCPMPDLQRILVTVPVDGLAAPAIVMDLNWVTALGKP